MKQRSKTARLIYFIVFAIVFLLCVPYVMFLAFGYDLGKNLSVFKTGGIYVYSSETGAKVYVNGKLDDSTSIFQHGILVKKLFSGEYAILVSKEGYLDWQKSVVVVEEQVAEAYSLLLPKEPVITEIPSRVSRTAATSSPLVDNPEYTSLTLLFAPKKALPALPQVKGTTTPILPTISSGKEVIEKNGAGLRAIWNGHINDSPFYFCLTPTGACQKDFVVYSSKDIGTFEFFPSRNDVVLVAVHGKLFAVELDRRAPQHIIELYSSTDGNDIDFRILNNETLAIKDGKSIKKLSLVI